MSLYHLYHYKQSYWCRYLWYLQKAHIRSWRFNIPEHRDTDRGQKGGRLRHWTPSPQHTCDMLGAAVSSWRDIAFQLLAQFVSKIRSAQQKATLFCDKHFTSCELTKYCYPEDPMRIIGRIIYKYIYPGRAGKEKNKQALIFSCNTKQLSYCGRLERLSYPDISTVIIGSGFWPVYKANILTLGEVLL